MTVKVIQKDHGAKRIMRDLRELAELVLELGYVGTTGGAIHPASRLTIAHMAAVHEFGGGTTPERSFIRSAITLGSKRIDQRIGAELGAVIDGKKKPVAALSAVGAFIIELIRKRLQTASAWASPLDVETAEDKGKATPLDDSGALARGLSWRVKRGGSMVAEGR